MSESSSSSRLLHLLGGPALLLLALALPIFGPIESRFGFGILFWMVWWWITCVVDIKLTCLVPIFVACVYSYMPLGKVLEAYVHREAVLIFGATAITCAWVRWGFARRLALNFLMRVNGSVRARPRAGSSFAGSLPSWWATPPWPPCSPLWPWHP